MWVPPQFAHFAVTWTQVSPLPLLQPATPQQWSSTLWWPAQRTHFGGRSPQFPIRSCPMPQHFIYTKLGPASQYLSNTLTTPPNQRPDTQSYFASVFPLNVVTMAEPRCLPGSYCSLRRLSVISQRGKAFSCIAVEDSTSCLSKSMLLLPRYLSSDIPCTLRRCQYSDISTLILCKQHLQRSIINY